MGILLQILPINIEKKLQCCDTFLVDSCISVNIHFYGVTHHKIYVDTMIL